MESNENVFIYAHDNSGSTSNNDNYFKKAQTYLKKFQEAAISNKSVNYLFWNNVCQSVDLETLNRLYTNLSGCGGTDPQTISQWIIDKKLHKKNIHLWLITDGEILESSILKCKMLNFRINFKSVTLVTINRVIIDNSVSFAFLNSNCIITLCEEISDIVKSPVVFNTSCYDFSQITYENFSEKYAELENYVISKYTIDFHKLELSESVKLNLEREAMEFVQQLKMKRNQLIAESPKLAVNPSTQINFEITEKSQKIIDKLKTLEFYKDFYGINKKPEHQFVVKIDALISFVHDKKKKSYSFAELKQSIHQHQYERKNNVDMEEVPDTEYHELSTEVNFHDCFSLCESNSPIICFNQCNYIVDFVKKNNQFFIQMIEYPFLLIDKKEFLDKKTFVCQTYDSGSFKQYMSFDSNYGTFPVTDILTRADLMGGIIPYEFADSWNDYSISCVFLNGKKVKQSFYDLIYFVLYAKLSKMQHVNRSVVQQLKQYAFYRIKNGKSKLSFSSLPLEPQEVVPIPIALFYCVQLSSIMFGEDQNLFKNEKLRNFCFTSQYIIQILKHFKMDLREEFIKKRSDLFVNLNKMKTMTSHKRSAFILGSIFKSKSGFLTNSLEAPENLYKMNYLEESLNAPVKLKSKEVTLNSIKDKVLFYYIMEAAPEVKICEKTGRPLYMVDGCPFYVNLCKTLKKLEIKDNSIKECSVKTMADIDFKQLLSMSKIYIRYVTDNKKYPLYSGFKEFLLKTKSFNDTNGFRKTCLFPENILDSLKKTLEMYEPIKEKMLVADFIALTKESVSIEKKKVMEKV